METTIPAPHEGYFGPPYGSHEQWQNRAYNIVEEHLGKEDFERRLAKQFQDGYNTPTWLSGLKLSWKSTKIRNLFGLDSIKGNGSFTYHSSVGGAGFAVLSENLNIPENDFFKPGKVFPIRMRHANLFTDDDASCDFRLASLKFADEDGGGPLDLIFSTGRMPLFYNLAELEKLDGALGKQEDGFRKWLFERPINYWAAVDGMRRAPTSYSSQVYYNHFTYHMTFSDESTELVRFRLVPAADVSESGLLNEQQQKQAWVRERHSDIGNRESYLSEEYESQVEKHGAVRWILQVQLHDVTELSGYNPCELWDPVTHPWRNVADVFVTGILPAQFTDKMDFNIDNRPDILSFPEAKSVFDFKSANKALQIMYECHQTRMQRRQVLQDPEEKVSSYVITLESGQQSRSGTLSSVQVTLQGKTRRTGRHTLSNVYLTSGLHVHLVKDRSIGNLIAIQVDIRHRLSSDWYLNRLLVTCLERNETYVFPCFAWFTDDNKTMVLRPDPAVSLPQMEQYTKLAVVRKWELQKKKEQYRWADSKTVVKTQVEGHNEDNLPGRIAVKEMKHLPRDAQIPEERIKHFWHNLNAGFLNLQLGRLASLISEWKHTDDFKTMVNRLLEKTDTMDYVMEHWTEDKEFGRQMLDGTYPTLIRRLASLPPNFVVPDDALVGVLDRGRTLGEEIQEGTIFMVEYPDLQTVLRYPDRYVAEATCLLYVRSDGALVPIAIRLQQSSDSHELIWTPNDSPMDWLCAKIWVKCAHYQYHQIVGRMMCRLMLEPIAVALNRCLSVAHPVYQLLQSHLKTAIGINVMDRQVFGAGYNEFLAIADGGHIALLKKTYKKFTFKILNLPLDLETRGVDDPAVLPNYHYRDDALALWQVIRQFVEKMISLFYHCDSDVAGDEEIQAWIDECHSKGFLNWEENIDHGFPDKISSLEELSEILTSVIFTATGQYAALNYSQYDYNTFAPNMPSTMNRPPPKEKGVVTMKSIVEMLPTRRQTAFSIAVAYAMSRHEGGEVLLGNYPEYSFTEPGPRKAVDNFQGDLKKLSSAIHVRNRKLAVPYRTLLPEKIPHFIAI
ncbi:allene oxide synthase-lipoxygenase protein [Lingula anatina]|uniref:Allene oxide synthase-lipoxygenase protein n=1 Tax=Lingula anatina TaxID=7574 RepID=A0A1S3HPY6_LINAN|nr:allene oxide synthase-lipoxygenase protein [Lingula anatina]|eukprot:XP_013388118.1 allene oxide synthase-lipoxygenase protein [Lingula anatina]